MQRISPAEWNAIYRRERTKALNAYKRSLGGCRDCGSMENLHFDHRDAQSIIDKVRPNAGALRDVDKTGRSRPELRAIEGGLIPARNAAPSPSLYRSHRDGA